MAKLLNVRRMIRAAVLLIGLVSKAEEFSCGVIHAKPHAALAASSAYSIGTKKLIFYRVRFSNDQDDPISLEEAGQTLAEVKTIYTRISKGKFQLISTVSPILHLTNNREKYGGTDGFDRFIDDVRAAGQAAGYDYLDYDFDIARHTGVPGFMGGNANLGMRGAQVETSGANVIVHELGHNLGLNHANLWVTGAPGLNNSSPPLPSNFAGTPDPRTIPVYPDSFLGHESIVGPGYSAEYGDAFDIMGSGTVEFTAVYRRLLGWLSDDEIAVAPLGLSIQQIQGTDGTFDSLPRAIRIPFHSNTPLGDREYWIQLPAIETNVALFAGVQIRWGDRSEQYAGVQLLSPAASAPGVNNGVILEPGKTFSDWPSQIHITVLDASGEAGARTANVAVYIGKANHPPAITVGQEPASAGVSEPITLAASASDPDGDALAWHWDFGDGFSSTNPSSVTKSWRRAGDFTVLLEVSDLKGGIAWARIPVRVGNPGGYRISGRVLTSEGKPVAGARVHNGISDAGSSEHRSLFTFTDSGGAYTLTDVQPGEYTPGAFLFGYAMARRSPLSVIDHDLTNVDFVATELPRVSVTAPAEIREEIGLTNLFLLTRTGPVEQPLTVSYGLSGTAAAGGDYVRPFITRAVIPAGASSTFVTMNIIDDLNIELNETIILDISYPTQDQRTDPLGNSYTVYFPGWELFDNAGILNWVQTDPTYIPGEGAFASVILKDNDAMDMPQTLSITLNSDGHLDVNISANPESRIVLESSSDFKMWTPIHTNILLNTYSTSVRLPASAQKSFLRSRIEDQRTF
jgi:hypothetical protein